MSRPQTSAGPDFAYSQDFGNNQQPTEDYFQSRPSTAGANNNVSYFNSSRPHTASSALKQLPKYITHDKKVLRFYGHFLQERSWDKQSTLGQPVIETFQPRNLTVLYYLVDDTIEVFETKGLNTGKLIYPFFTLIFIKTSFFNRNDGRKISKTIKTTN